MCRCGAQAPGPNSQLHSFLTTTSASDRTSQDLRLSPRKVKITAVGARIKRVLQAHGLYPLLSAFCSLGSVNWDNVWRETFWGFALGEGRESVLTFSRSQGCCSMHRTVPTMKSHLSPDVNSLRLRNARLDIGVQRILIPAVFPTSSGLSSQILAPSFLLYP